ncbi:MAG TPA: four helix bundle protein [Moheibacter sp.]|nr:four helix bundle protein [Moheibacter sp.]
MTLIKYHKDLIVYQKACDSAMQIYALTKSFPVEERYSLTDQIRRSSRSVCGNISEAWRKRRYEKLFINKLIDSEGEAGGAQNWLDFSLACNYIDEEIYNELYLKYDEILAMLVKMSKDSEKWTFNPQ